MKKVLYISNIEVPYRNEFFNQLSKKCDLTVLYERKKSSNRDEKWSKSIKSNYKIEYLNGINFKKEYSFDLGILKYIFNNKYDKIIIGCYNSLSQMISIIFMKIFKKRYILNLDGECFIEENSLKTKIKTFFIKGAYKYLVAGEKSAKSLTKIVDKTKIKVYYFSSLTNKELEENSKHINKNINNKILVVGQYFDYKGIDIALEIAKKDSKILYKFIGMGNRSILLNKKIKEMNLKNVKVIPFLEKEKLYKEFQNCKLLILPSKRECWGLVINEAASFGCPIISTHGSGAAVEFLEKKYLAKPNNANDLYNKILNLKITNRLKQELIKKSKKYSIENSVKYTLEIINKD